MCRGRFFSANWLIHHLCCWCTEQSSSQTETRLPVHLDNFYKGNKMNLPVWKQDRRTESKLNSRKSDARSAKFKWFSSKYIELLDTVSVGYIQLIIHQCWLSRKQLLFRQILLITKMSSNTFGNISELSRLSKMLEALYDFPRAFAYLPLLFDIGNFAEYREPLVRISRNYAASIRKPRCAWWNPTAAGSLSREKVDW